MTAPYNHRFDVFTDWLDAQVTGKSTPDHELAADTDLADLCAVADQFHGLAERLGQDATRVSPSTRTWEEIMAVNPALLSSVSSVPSPRPATAPPWWGGSTHQRFDRFATGALAATLVVAIGGGAWLAAEGNSFGGDNEPPATIGFGGFGPESDNSNRVVPEVTVSPDDQMSSIPYPSAAECTVELPPREWVENHIQQTIDTTTPPASTLYEWPIEPTQGEIDGVMATFRLWQACQLVGAARAQAFTLETPWMTKNMGMIWGMAEQSITEAEFTYLVEIAMTGSEEEMSRISNDFYEGTPGAPVVIYATPGASPMADPMAEYRGEREYAPYPEGATPVARSGTRSAVGTIFADGIQMVGPDRAWAQLYAVSPETGEVMIGSEGSSYVVELVRIDGVWLIDFYGEPNRG
jgi:hypothetical protein